MCDQIPEFLANGKTDKAMRWLGWIQGVCYGLGEFSLKDLKEHSMPDNDVLDVGKI